MEIRNEHFDFAVVDRLRQMLVDRLHTPYEITLSYALFGTILCWLMQHIRNDESSGPQDKMDEAAVRVAHSLRKEHASALPWKCDLLAEVVPYGKKGFELSASKSDFELSAFGLLKMIRDGIAHGDKRNVSPLHTKASDGKRILRGFEIGLEWKKRSKFGKVRLYHEDMIRVGGRLAGEYCAALQAVADDSHLAEDAKMGIAEAA